MAVSELNARCAGVGEDTYDNTLVVAFAESAASDAVLILQRAFSFDEQDRDLGMDTDCLIGPGQATSYGGVTSWSLNGSILTLHLTRAAADTLGLEAEVRVVINADPPAALDSTSAVDLAEVVSVKSERVGGGQPVRDGRGAITRLPRGRLRCGSAADGSPLQSPGRSRRTE